MSPGPEIAPDRERVAREGRRSRARERLGPRGVLLLPAAAEPRAGSATELNYLADSDVYYLSGCAEPDVVLALCGSPDQPASALFTRERDPERELWTGVRTGVEEAVAAFGVDVAWPLSELERRLPELLAHTDTLYYRMGSSVVLDRLVPELLAAARAKRPRSGEGLHTLSDPGRVLDELRLYKDEIEIARLRAACELTVASFRELRGLVRPGVGEWELEAALAAGFRRRGAQGPAFPTIVASGANATILHYSRNQAMVGPGELVLVDAGARVAMYCGDVTRCYPADGRFSATQRALYDVVRRAHAAAVAAARPGAPVSAVHDAALQILVAGLVELQLLTGDPVELVQQAAAYKRFYPHRTSHWLGLDVHDVGDYVVAGEARPLQAGMVLTVEPGLYVPADAEAVPPGLRGIGIRLEDDVLITSADPEVLTAALPLDPAALFD